MNVFQLNFNCQFADINPIFAGESVSPPGTCQENRRFPYTIIHYVRSGCGTVTARGNTYRVSAGQIFIFLPGEAATYIADDNDPWSFRWVGFSGTLAAAFAGLPPVLDVPKDVFDNLCDLLHPGCLLEYQLSSEILYLQARVLPEPQKEDDPVRWVMDYIEASYMNEISVQKLAEQVNLDRSYLYRLFKKRNGCSIQDYILKIRLRKAIWYLGEGYSTQEAATLCGFKNMSNFHRQFKMKADINTGNGSNRTPTQWKKDAMKWQKRRSSNDKDHQQ